MYSRLVGLLSIDMRTNLSYEAAWLLRGPPFHFSDSTRLSLKGFLEKIKIRLRAGSRRYGFDPSVSSSAGKYVALNKASLPEVYKWSGTA